MSLDWGSLFALSQPLAETIVGGSAVYCFLFLLFRFVVRRDMASVGLADVLVLVIVADAAQNAMAGEYTSITDGFILIGTIVFWDFLLNWLGYRFPGVGRFAEPAVLPLVKDGRILHGNLRRQFIGKTELMAKLRENGLEDPSQVKHAYMESDGSISVIRRDS